MIFLKNNGIDISTISVKGKIEFIAGDIRPFSEEVGYELSKRYGFLEIVEAPSEKDKIKKLHREQGKSIFDIFEKEINLVKKQAQETGNVEHFVLKERDVPKEPNVELVVESISDFVKPVKKVNKFLGRPKSKVAKLEASILVAEPVMAESVLDEPQPLESSEEVVE